jgi:hypothetical protein
MEVLCMDVKEKEGELAGCGFAWVPKGMWAVGGTKPTDNDGVALLEVDADPGPSEPTPRETRTGRGRGNPALGWKNGFEPFNLLLAAKLVSVTNGGLGRGEQKLEVRPGKAPKPSRADLEKAVARRRTGRP